MTPIWQTHIHAFAGQRAMHCLTIRVLPCLLHPRERMLLRKWVQGVTPCRGSGAEPHGLCGLVFPVQPLQLRSLYTARSNPRQDQVGMHRMDLLRH